MAQVNTNTKALAEIENGLRGIDVGGEHSVVPVGDRGENSARQLESKGLFVRMDTHDHKHTYTHTHKQMYTHTHIHTNKCTLIHMHVYMYTLCLTHTHTHTVNSNNSNHIPNGHVVQRNKPERKYTEIDIGSDRNPSLFPTSTAKSGHGLSLLEQIDGAQNGSNKRPSDIPPVLYERVEEILPSPLIEYNLVRCRLSH